MDKWRDGWMDDRVENGWRNGGITSSKELTFTCPCRSWHWVGTCLISGYVYLFS